MSKLIHLLVAVSVAVPFVATACAKADAPSGGSQDFSKEIAEGKTLYIVSSEAGCDQLVDLGPEKATLSIAQSQEGLCDLTLSYDFVYSSAHFSLHFFIPNVSMKKNEDRFDVQCQKLQGVWSFTDSSIERFLLLNGFKQEDLPFENVSVSGSVGFDGHAVMDLSGSIGGEAFRIKVLETAVAYPGSQAKAGAIIDYKCSNEISITNTSSTPYDIHFGLDHYTGQQSDIHLEVGESKQLRFYFDELFWGGECAEMTISAQGGKSVTIAGSDIANTKPGSNVAPLSRLDNGVRHCIRAVKENHLIEPVATLVENYALHDPVE